MVFPAEGINAAEIHDALSTCVNIEVFGASSVARHGKYVFSNYVCNLPSIFSEDFIDKINEFIDRNDIDLIIPTHDTVVCALANMSDRLHCKTTVPNKETAAITRSKIKTWELFKDESFVPARYDSGNVRPPLFAKPDDGQGGKGAFKIDDERQLSGIDTNKYLITEFLGGQEYTVDCFTDCNGVLQHVSTRTRERIRAGVTDQGRIVTTSQTVKDIATKINSKLKFTGLWYFQLREDKEGNPKLMEISARCAGTMCLTRAKGINLPLLTVYAAMGYETSIIENDYNVVLDRSVSNCYSIDYKYSKVYIDFDDTITVRGKVNLSVIRYIYQCRNKNVSVILLTKHAADIISTLNTFAISPKLFSQIVHISSMEKKSDVINRLGTQQSIFIDNMFKERLDVANNCHIPVFDVDQIDVLQDFRL